MTNKLSDKETFHIASLCNIPIDEKEEEKLSQMLGETLDFIKNLDELDTSKVEETYQVTGQTNVFQGDEEKPDSLNQEQALFNAKNKKNKMIGTKAVFKR